MDIFKIYRCFWDYCFSNPEKMKPNDIAIFSFAVEHCNRLGWKKKFGFPTAMAMEATGIKSYSVYKKHLDNLIECGFIKIIEYSKNQYSSNIIALEENYKALDKAHNKALDKAMIKHTTKQSESTQQSTVQSNDSIIRQYTIDNKQQTIDNRPETETKKEIFHPSEIAEQVNRIFGKELTERRIPRLDRDIINDLITVYGYTKMEVVKAWENMSRDKWHKEHKNVITLQYLGQTKTMERFSGTSNPDTPTEGMIFKRSSLNL